jgi:hypothetical protein
MYMQSTLDLKQTWKPSQNFHYCLFVSFSTLLHSVQNFSLFHLLVPASTFLYSVPLFFTWMNFLCNFNSLKSYYPTVCSAKFEVNNVSLQEWLQTQMHTWVQKRNHCMKQMLMTDCSHRLPALREDQLAGYTPVVNGWQYCGLPSSHNPRLWYTHQMHCLQKVECLEWPLTYKQIALWIK